jgi:hypothetical protein
MSPFDPGDRETDTRQSSCSRYCVAAAWELLARDAGKTAFIRPVLSVFQIIGKSP